MSGPQDRSAVWSINHFRLVNGNPLWWPVCLRPSDRVQAWSRGCAQDDLTHPSLRRRYDARPKRPAGRLLLLYRIANSCATQGLLPTRYASPKPCCHCIASSPWAQALTAPARLQDKRMDCYWITQGELMDFTEHRANFLVCTAAPLCSCRPLQFRPVRSTRCVCRGSALLMASITPLVSIAAECAATQRPWARPA